MNKKTAKHIACGVKKQQRSVEATPCLLALCFLGRDAKQARWSGAHVLEPFAFAYYVLFLRINDLIIQTNGVGVDLREIASLIQELLFSFTLAVN